MSKTSLRKQRGIRGRSVPVDVSTSNLRLEFGNSRSAITREPGSARRAVISGSDFWAAASSVGSSAGSSWYKALKNSLGRPWPTLDTASHVTLRSQFLRGLLVNSKKIDIEHKLDFFTIYYGNIF